MSKPIIDKKISITALIIVLVAAIGFAFYFYIWPFLKIMLSIFQNYLPTRVWLEYLGFFVIGATFAGMFTVATWGIIWLLSKKNLEKWSGMTIFFIFFFSIVGLLFIDSELSLTKEIGLKLWADDMTEKLLFGEIHCTDEDKQLFVGDTVLCTITPTLYNVTGEIKLYSGNKLLSSTEVSPPIIDFRALDEVTYISFKLEGYDSSNKKRNLSTGWPYTFLTDHIIENSAGQFKQYLFALLSLILVLVPTSIASIKSISEKK